MCANSFISVRNVAFMCELCVMTYAGSEVADEHFYMSVNLLSHLNTTRKMQTKTQKSGGFLFLIDVTPNISKFHHDGDRYQSNATANFTPHFEGVHMYVHTNIQICFESKCFFSTVGQIVYLMYTRTNDVHTNK